MLVILIEGGELFVTDKLNTFYSIQIIVNLVTPVIPVSLLFIVLSRKQRTPEIIRKRRQTVIGHLRYGV